MDQATSMPMPQMRPAAEQADDDWGAPPDEPLLSPMQAPPAPAVAIAQPVAVEPERTGSGPGTRLAAIGAGVAIMVVIAGVLLSRMLGSTTDRPAAEPDRAVRVVRLASPTPVPFATHDPATPPGDDDPIVAEGPNSGEEPETRPRNTLPPPARNRREVVAAMLRHMEDPSSSAHMDLSASYRVAGVKFGIAGDFDLVGADLQGAYRMSGPVDGRIRMVIKDGIVWMNEGGGWVTRGMDDAVGGIQPIGPGDLALLRYEGPVTRDGKRVYRFRHVELDWPTVAQLTAPTDQMRIRDLDLVYYVDGYGRVVEQRMNAQGTMLVGGIWKPMTMEQRVSYGRFGQKVVITAPAGSYDTPNA
jgi:hypothetical protein